MDASRTTEAETASPCTDICLLNERTGLCEGCWRSMDEISAWRSASEEERRAILRRIDERKAGAGTAAG